LRSVDALFSPYRPDSAVSRMARGELSLVDADPLVRDVAARCAHASAITAGLFDATRADGRWDPSGLVKGWAAERAFRHLSGVAGLDWCLNAGGDVILACPSGLPFVVGIEDPSDPGAVIATLSLTSGAVATSGEAARGAHLYDPRTGLPPAPRWRSVSVTGPSLETADVLATAAFVAGAGWEAVVAGVPGYAGLALAADGSRENTPDWPDPSTG